MRQRRASDVLGLGAAWAAGLLLIVAFGGLVAWLAVQGLSSVSLSFVASAVGLDEGGLLTGGVREPLIGSILLVVLATLIALPIGIGVAVFISEYRRPSWLARATESAVEVIFGLPDIVIALFGVAVFTSGIFVFASQPVGGAGKATGQSFVVCAALMSLLAIPPIVRSTQEALRQIPQSQREASYALGKTKATTILRLLLPGARPGIATGTIIGMGRVVGDTAIVLLLLGGTLGFGDEEGYYRPENFIDTLRGTGSTLTTYVFNSSPAGEFNNEQNAYGAALVLLALILLLNGLVVVISRRNSKATGIR